MLKNGKLVNKSEIARRIGISRSYVSLLISGKRKSKKYEKAIRKIINNELQINTNK